MNVFDAPIEQVEVMGVYRQMPLPPRRLSKAGRKPGAVASRRRINVKIWLTAEEYEFIKAIPNKSRVGREALLREANHVL